MLDFEKVKTLLTLKPIYVTARLIQPDNSCNIHVSHTQNHLDLSPL